MIRAAILVGLSLSIGWGVRGNFGHEYGAMLPGALAALAGVLVFGQRDWLNRLGYFPLFGALGWAFGGSISYMQVIAYTHSGHWPSVVYGFSGLFVIGFLWAAMGGLGTVWPAEASGRRLSSFFRPLTWVISAWILLHFFLIWLSKVEASYIDDRTWQRQASALYWLDSDWIQTLAAALALVLFEVWDSRFRYSGKLLLIAGLGAASGWVIQHLLTWIGLLPRLLVWPVVQYQADVSQFSQWAEQRGQTAEQLKADLLTNWPNWFALFPQHVGWTIGLLAGLAFFMARYGRFRSGSGLLMSMAVGWMVGFLLMPVLLGFGGAGLRMTPPRGDNWAGIVGVVFGTIGWLLRHGYTRATYAGLLCGLVGGLGFAGAAFLKLLLVAPGNPTLTSDTDLIERWKFWQHSNWHSFLEQSYGLINGLGVFIAVYWLSKAPSRFARDIHSEPPAKKHIMAIASVLFGVIFLNMFKNVRVWVEHQAVPKTMRLPGFDGLEFSAEAWFILAFVTLTVCSVALMHRHLRHPLEWLPVSWMGRGQLFYLILLWAIVVMNFERALVRFSEGRMLTEGVIFFNAVIVTWLVSTSKPVGAYTVAATESIMDQVVPKTPWLRLAAIAAVVLAVCALGMPVAIRKVYGDAHAGHSGLQKRFGPDALWRTTPIFKSKKHS